MLDSSLGFSLFVSIIITGIIYFVNRDKYINSDNKLNFSHGISYKINDELTLIGSYHPSPRNVNTGRIDSKKMINLLIRIKKKLNIKND